MAQNVRVLIIDDHPLFRQGIRWSLEEAGDMEVVGEAENGQEAIKLAERLLPDVVLVDINLPGLNGLEVARVIKRREPRIGMIVLSVYEDDDQLFQAIKVGAAAYSSKDVHPAELLRMIREVARGHYRIIQEALQNAHKYARGANITVRLVQHGGALHLAIRDDGPGFDAREVNGANSAVVCSSSVEASSRNWCSTRVATCGLASTLSLIK